MGPVGRVLLAPLLGLAGVQANQRRRSSSSGSVLTMIALILLSLIKSRHGLVGLVAVSEKVRGSRSGAAGRT